MAKVTKRLPGIPAERTLKIISGRWKATILYYLFDGPKRLSELRRLVPCASQKVLIEQLRELEEHGVVCRKAYLQVPVRVDYTVTPLGSSLRAVIMTLCEWGRRHAEELAPDSDLAVPVDCIETSSSGVRLVVMNGTDHVPAE